jgi:hypothetical protein
MALGLTVAFAAFCVILALVIVGLLIDKSADRK